MAPGFISGGPKCRLRPSYPPETCIKSNKTFFAKFGKKSQKTLPDAPPPSPIRGKPARRVENPPQGFTAVGKWKKKKVRHKKSLAFPELGVYTRNKAVPQALSASALCAGGGHLRVCDCTQSLPKEKAAAWGKTLRCKRFQKPVHTIQNSERFEGEGL